MTLLVLFMISISTHEGWADITLLAIKGAALVDVRTSRQIGNSAILIEKDRIKEVGDASNLQIPTDARVIDAHGKWVIPGLIDAVILRGCMFDRTALDAMLAEIEVEAKECTLSR